MTLNFPNNPSNGTVYSLANGATYTYDGTKWKASNIPDSSSVVQTNDNPSDGEVLTYDGTLGAVVWSASSGGGGVTVKEEGTALTTDATSLNFVGTSVTASGTTADKTITITDTTYSDFVGSNVGGTPTTGTAGLVPAPAGNQGYYFLRGDANWGGNATTSIPGLMSDVDKSKLDGIPAGANIGIPSLADDPSPQLGASLDVNGNSISTAANNDNVVIAPHGTGALNVSSSKIINVTDPTLAQDAATKAYVDANAGGGISNVVEDTSPQLGGNLDVLDKSITTSTGSNTDIVISPKGTGSVDVDSSKITSVTDPTSAQDAATKNYVDTNAVTLTGAQTLENKTLDDYLEKELVQSVSSSATHTLAAASVSGGAPGAHIHYVSYYTNCTVTIDLDNGQSMLVMVYAGNNTITWSAPVWVGGSAPTLNTSGYSVTEFWKVNNTTYGAYVGDL